MRADDEVRLGLRRLVEHIAGLPGDHGAGRGGSHGLDGAAWIEVDAREHQHQPAPRGPAMNGPQQIGPGHSRRPAPTPPGLPAGLATNGTAETCSELSISPSFEEAADDLSNPSFGKRTMDKDRVAGSAKKIKGSIKEVVGKAAGDAKLEAEGKADKVEGNVQNAVGLKDTLKSTASTRLRATSQRKTLLASAAMIGADLFCGPAGAQGVSQSASPTSQTRLAKPSRSRGRSDGSHATETALIPDVVPPAAPERRPRQRYEDWGDHVPMFLLHSVSSSHPKPGQRRFE